MGRGLRSKYFGLPAGKWNCELLSIKEEILLVLLLLVHFNGSKILLFFTLKVGLLEL